jgi:hypothetical protein
MWMTYGKDFEVITVRFEHSNTKVTMRYLGVEAEEVNHMLLNECRFYRSAHHAKDNFNQ